MTDIDKVCRIVSNKLKVDYELVSSICKYQFKFIREVMQDENDNHDILINNLFRFKLKPRFKLDKSSEYSPHKK